jgi:heavy metal efflux system protein
MNKFLRSLVTFGLANRFFLLLGALVLMAWGVYSFMATPIIAFPDLTNTRVIVISQWEGRSAEEVERFVTIPIEKELNSCPKRLVVRSITLFGLSVVYVLFDDSVEDIEARQYVMTQMLNVDMPDDVNSEMEPTYGPTDEVFRYTLQSKIRSPRELKTIQDWVIDKQIRVVPGISDIVSFGGEIKTFEISIDPALLNKYDLTSVNIFNALENSNLNVGGGVIVKSNQAYVVRGLGLFKSIKDIEKVIIANNNGTPVLLKNVGAVVESHLPSLGYVGRDSINNTVQGLVVMRRGMDPTPILKAIRAKVDELNEYILPQDVEVVTFYDRQELIDYTIETVTHNVREGVLLVCLIIFLFLGDWRATLIASITIPFALLFSFTCLHLAGMSANLLSLGAIDFGIIVDGTVVMVEGLYIILDKRAKELGMERFNKSYKFGLIRKEGGRLAKSVFFAAIIIITALLPIFTFQRVEGKMFSPLAYTLGCALLGALMFSLILVPILVSFLMNKNVVEKHTWLSEGIHKIHFKTLTWCSEHRRAAYITGICVLFVALFIGSRLGTEFLPHLNEGSIYVRASMPLSTSLDQSIEISNRLRTIMRSYPEVKRVLSQTGRPDDGTDPTGFFNIEFHMELNPQEQWKRKITKNELISEMEDQFTKYEGIDFNFSQPIMDNVEEAVSGVKGSMAVKIYGYDTDRLGVYASEVFNILKSIDGVEDLAIISLTGQPEIKITLDEDKMAVYGVTIKDAQSVIEMAIGGKTATYLFEDDRKFDVRVRYMSGFRDNEDDIGNLYVPTINGGKVPLRLIAGIKRETGLAFLYRENNKRFIGVKFSVRGRDLGSTVQEAREKIAKAIKLDKGEKIEYAGEFENQERAMTHLAQVAPISLILIFFFLYLAFGNVLDAGLIFLNVPFGLTGGLLCLYLTGTNFGISAGIGFICLFGVSVQAGVILISIFKYNLQDGMLLREAVFTGTLRRVRPVFMTATMAIIGLMPAALSTGIGSETQKPLALVVIGGLFTDMILSVHIFPLIVEYVYRRFKKIE